MPRDSRPFYDSTVGLPDETMVLPRIENPVIRQLPDNDPMARKLNQALDKLELLKDALDLVADLWPRPGYASVTLETHQWVKLRRVLLAVPELVANDE